MNKEDKRQEFEELLNEAKLNKDKPILFKHIIEQLVELQKELDPDYIRYLRHRLNNL